MVIKTMKLEETSEDKPLGKKEIDVQSLDKDHDSEIVRKQRKLRRSNGRKKKKKKAGLRKTFGEHLKDEGRLTVIKTVLRSNKMRTELGHLFDQNENF